VDVVSVCDGCRVVVHEPRTKVDLTRYLENHGFRFDTVFDEDADNVTVYK
jgi:kinesin family protein 2/24